VISADLSGEIARVVREQTGHLVGALVRGLGDFALAEDLVQDALVEALEHWPREGLPRRPGAWLLATARRKAIDRARRDARYRQKLSLLELTPTPVEAAMHDDRLPLLFTCCHPALSREAQVALTLRAVVGLSTAQIARAFLTSEATVSQRIVRAKRKIVEAQIPFRVPPDNRLRERLSEVLTVVYLTFNEGYLASGPEASAIPDLADDAGWLASLLARLLPREPEALGLLALLRLQQARAATRFDTNGRLVLLQDQDRSRWDHAAIAAASELLERALALGQPGPYQLQAAIAACHAEASSWQATDWRQIVALYTTLLRLAPSPVVALNRAIAAWHVHGAAAALADVEALAEALSGYHLYHATRAELLRDLSRTREAAAADARALELTANPAERALLRQRLDGGSKGHESCR
jgi:RNA polymerase sigma factor (sigma-70 family)